MPTPQEVRDDEMAELMAENERLRAALAECRKMALAGYWAAKSNAEEAKFEAISETAKIALGAVE